MTGIANAVSRLKDSKSKSKVVILLTDGSNNMGEISPMTYSKSIRSAQARDAIRVGCAEAKLPSAQQAAAQIDAIRVVCAEAKHGTFSTC